MAGGDFLLKRLLCTISLKYEICCWLIVVQSNELVLKQRMDQHATNWDSGLFLQGCKENLFQSCGSLLFHAGLWIWKFDTNKQLSCYNPQQNQPGSKTLTSTRSYPWKAPKLDSMYRWCFLSSCHHGACWKACLWSFFLLLEIPLEKSRWIQMQTSKLVVDTPKSQVFVLKV